VRRLLNGRFDMEWEQGMAGRGIGTTCTKIHGLGKNRGGEFVDIMGCVIVYIAMTDVVATAMCLF